MPVLEAELEWPAGFATALEWAIPGASRPRMLDEIASVGWDRPHHVYLLRSMSAISFELKDSRTGDRIGMIDHEKAIREAYPGATYIHFGRHYRVVEWRNTTYERSILLKSVRSAEPTQAIVRFQIGASIQVGELIEDHLLTAGDDFLAEAQLRAAESVEGYRIGSTALLYRDLSEKDRRLSRKQREFLTTGVVMRIGAPWFAGTSETQVATRRAVAVALETILVREYGVAPGDIRFAHTGVALHSQAGARKLDDAIALFDTIPGGLRLSAPLFEDFEKVVERLERGAELAGQEALLPMSTVEKLKAWRGTLHSAEPRTSECALPEGKHLVFAPSSRVSIRIRGEAIERVLLEPQLLSFGASEQLMYRYESSPGVQAWVAADQVEPTGSDWQRAIWNPAENTFQKIESNT